MKDKPYSLNITKAGQLHQTIILEPLLRINPDIQKWRYALRNAEDPENPNRNTLYDIYEETLLDGMVTSVTERISLKCTNSKIIFEKKGQADKEHPVSKLTKTPVFLEVIRRIIEAKWWGHSLIELEFNDGMITDAHLIPRKNVIPEKGMVVKRAGEQEGTFYRQSPYIDYLLEIGEDRDLGLFNKATPYTIFKRFGISSWGEFLERFGIPIQEYQYDPQNPNSRKEVERQAKEQGAGSKIVMPLGTTTKIHAPANASGSAVFKDYKEANDDEILLIFLLQTMTTKNGSSRSQAEVHEGGEDELIAGYKLFVELILNFQLKPLLAKHGFDTEDGEFKYEDTEKLSKQDLLKLFQGLSQFGDVPFEVIEKHFGIKLTPKKDEPNAKEDKEQEDKEPNDKEEKEDKEKNKLEGSKKKSRYDLGCNCLLHEDNVVELALTKEDENGLLKRIFEKKGKSKFDSKYFNALASGFISELNGAWNAPKSLDYNSPDHLSKTLLELNLYRFSATKDLQVLKELNELVASTKGFSEFQQEANSILDKHNKNHLQTEFNLVQATAQNNSNYLRNLEVADTFPYWEYRTVGDDRVRPSHAALDGLLFPAGETGALTTPNGFGCRCEYIPRDSKKGKKLVSEDDAKKILGDEFDKMKKAGFAVNRAEAGLVFTEDQMYISKFSENSLGFLDFGLQPYSTIKAKAKKASLTKRTEEKAKEWFSSLLGTNNLSSKDNVRFLDFNERPIHLNLETLLSNKAWDVLDFIPGLLSKPNEVYFKREKGGYMLSMIKYFNPKPLIVEVFVTPKDSKIISWSFAKDASKVRSGLLIKKS